MRILALLTVVWSFVAMPALCRAGILVDCCALGTPAREESHDEPDGCPCECPDENRESRPDDTGPSSPRDCDACADACSAVSPNSKQLHDDDVALLFVAAIAIALAPGDVISSNLHRSRDPSVQPLYDHLPNPISDRPLLI